MKGFYLVLGLMFSSFIAFTQNLSEDLKSSSKYLASIKEFKFNVKVDIYEDMKDAKPYMGLQGKILKLDNNFWNEIDGKEFFTDYINFIVVDHTSRQVNYSKGSNQVIERRLAQNNLIGIIDSLAVITDSVIYNGIRNGTKEYVILQKDGLIHTTIIQLDTATFILKKITYLYDVEEMETNNKVVAYYDFTTKLNGDDTGKLRLSNYVEFVSDKPRLSSHFKGYSLKN